MPGCHRAPKDGLLWGESLGRGKPSRAGFLRLFLYARPGVYPVCMTDRAVTYGSYLAVDELLELQRPRSEGPEHDEMLFIVIHQVYELWFKQILHEVDHVIALLERGDAHRAQHTLKRILTILKVLVAQLDILETMTPLEFQSFRAAARSGERIPVRSVPAARVRARQQVDGGDRALSRRQPRARARCERRFGAPTLWDAFLHYLSREGYAVPAALLSRDVTRAHRAVGGAAGDPDRRVSHATRSTPRCASGSSISTKGLQEWRYRHVKMVQRTIGAKLGTGGSSGAGISPRR